MTEQAVALEHLVDPEHPLLRWAQRIPWAHLETTLGARVPGHPVRLMLGLQLLRIARGLSDEDLCAQWVENPYFQAFCGEASFRRHLPVGPAMLQDWRQRAAGWEALCGPEAPVADERSYTFVIDVDGVVATLVPDNDYRLCQPIPEIVAAVNRLYDRGHRIVMMTARGSATGLDWHEVTREQMKRWGLKYSDLIFGKPAADYYVDDRMISIERLCALSLGRDFGPGRAAPASPKSG